MKGQNKITLSQDAMCEAIEYWLTNSVMKNPVAVSKVEKMMDYGSCESFVVTVEAQ